MVKMEERVEEMLGTKEWRRIQDAGERLWNRWTVRCQAPDCKQGGGARLSLLAKYSGVHYNNRWYPHVDCLKSALTGRLSQALQSYATGRERVHRLPFGLLMVNRGAISAEQLKEALRLQREGGYGKLSYWLEQIVPVDEAEVTAALGQQWGCPVFRPKGALSFVANQGDVPIPILAAANAVPVHSTLAGKQMHIAFSERIDHTLLYAVEDMLGCRTIACVSSATLVREALENLRRHDAGAEICFDTVRDAGEMAATICSYAIQMQVRRIKTVRAGAYIWVGFFQKHARRDLLFRLPGAGADGAGRERIKGNSSSADS
ncbi:MAG TPA: hypothetical protein VFI38_16705 [Candidatus Acidoferrum sp.]|nr:hypothetical protein [Candidatus Acidoferrum sp.]